MHPLVAGDRVGRWSSCTSARCGCRPTGRVHRQQVVALRVSWLRRRTARPPPSAAASAARSRSGRSARCGSDRSCRWFRRSSRMVSESEPPRRSRRGGWQPPQPAGGRTEKKEGGDHVTGPGWRWWSYGDSNPDLLHAIQTLSQLAIAPRDPRVYQRVDVTPSGRDRIRPAAPRRHPDRWHRDRGPAGGIGVLGDRILAVGDLSAVADADVVRVMDVTDRVVSPSYVDPPGIPTGRCSSTVRWPATFTRASRPSSRATAATPSRRSPTPAALSSICRSGRTSSRRAGRPSPSISRGWRSRSAPAARDPGRARHGHRIGHRTGFPRGDAGRAGGHGRRGRAGDGRGGVRAIDQAHLRARDARNAVRDRGPGGGGGPRRRLYSTHMRNEDATGCSSPARRGDRHDPRRRTSCAAPGLPSQVRIADCLGPRRRAWRGPRRGARADSATTWPPTSIRTPAAGTTLATILPPALQGNT